MGQQWLRDNARAACILWEVSWQQLLRIVPTRQPHAGPRDLPVSKAVTLYFAPFATCCSVCSVLHETDFPHQPMCREMKTCRAAFKFHIMEYCTRRRISFVCFLQGHVQMLCISAVRAGGTCTFAFLLFVCA